MTFFSLADHYSNGWLELPVGCLEAFAAKLVTFPHNLQFVPRLSGQLHAVLAPVLATCFIHERLKGQIKPLR